MALSIRTLCMWIVILKLMARSISVARNICHSSHDSLNTSIKCLGIWDDLSVSVSKQPSYTHTFEYVAYHDVNIGEVNFTYLTELKELIISKATFRKGLIVAIQSLAQNIFDPLTHLQIVRINIDWSFEHPLDDLFRPLVHLEELDLSRTRRLNIFHLHRAMYGLSNSTTLKTIKLSNIQTFKLGGTYSTFNLTWFLEPVKNCKIKRLYLAYNSLTAIYPGIIQYAPHLEYLDVSHNFLAEVVMSAFFIETLLHKGLQEIDLSYQGSGWFETGIRSGETQYLPPSKSNLQLFTLTSNESDNSLFTQYFPVVTPFQIDDVFASARIMPMSLATTIQTTLQHRIAGAMPEDVDPESWM